MSATASRLTTLGGSDAAAAAGEFSIRDCYVRVDEDGIWIEALHMTEDGVRVSIERCNFHILVAAFGKSLVFAFDHDRDRLNEQGAVIRVLCAKGAE